jgi:hypothetical protein
VQRPPIPAPTTITCRGIFLFQSRKCDFADAGFSQTVGHSLSLVVVGELTCWSFWQVLVIGMQAGYSQSRQYVITRSIFRCKVGGRGACMHACSGLDVENAKIRRLLRSGAFIFRTILIVSEVRIATP